MSKLKSSNIKIAQYTLILPFSLLLFTMNSCTNNDKKATDDDVEVTVSKTDSLVEKSEEIIADTERIPFRLESGSKDVYVVVEEQAMFPGREEGLINYMNNNIKYPQSAIEKGLEGRVITRFIVEKDGSLSDVEIIRGVDPLLDNEARRLIESMPKWKPGKVYGKEVRVRYTLPVTFRVQQ
jgi:protein TonB